jgi:hypothetical protein
MLWDFKLFTTRKRLPNGGLPYLKLENLLIVEYYLKAIDINSRAVFYSLMSDVPFFIWF